MRVHQKPFNNPKAKAIITGMVEVVLPMNLWSQIKNTQKQYYRITASWVTRSCLFKLFEDENFYKSKKFLRLKKKAEAITKQLRTKTAKNKDQSEKEKFHRQKVCLYGDDEAFLKCISLQLRIPMSILIRIALLWYLPEIQKVDKQYLKAISIQRKSRRKSQRNFPKSSQSNSRKSPKKKMSKEEEKKYLAQLLFEKIKKSGTKVVKELVSFQIEKSSHPKKIGYNVLLFREAEYW